MADVLLKVENKAATEQSLWWSSLVARNKTPPIVEHVRRAADLYAGGGCPTLRGCKYHLFEVDQGLGIVFLSCFTVSFVQGVNGTKIIYLINYLSFLTITELDFEGVTVV